MSIFLDACGHTEGRKGRVFTCRGVLTLYKWGCVVENSFEHVDEQGAELSRIWLYFKSLVLPTVEVDFRRELTSFRSG